MRSRKSACVVALLALACVPLSATWAQHGGGGRGGAGAAVGGHGVSTGVGPGAGRETMGRGTINRSEVAGAAREVSQTARSMGGPIALGAEQRRSHARTLWHAHADALDFDPRDQLIVRGQVVAVPSGPAALEAARAAGYRMVQEASFDGLGVALTVLEPPPGVSLRRALKRLRKADPQGAYDFNHVYFESGAAIAAPDVTAPAHGGPVPRNSLKIGLVDAGLASAHPALEGLDVHRHGCDGNVVPSTHGTAVASLLRSTLGASAEAPVQIYAADVYCGRPTGGSVTELVAALGWLAQQGVPVVNVSLVGPANALLQRAVQGARDRGVLIVAAVGNDGPTAPPLYPASYPGAVAVTGVDGSARVLIEAGRGTHVDFAAPGADIEAASLPEGFAPVRGTSYAAPVVAASLARLLERPDPALAAQAIATLARSAVDLGAQGFDPRYGHGCIGCSPRQARSQR